MRSYELRIYTLATRKDLDFYKDVIYVRHLESSPKFGIRAHGIWSRPSETEHRLYVLVSMDEGTDHAESEKRYMGSPEFRRDLEGFDPSKIKGVEVILLDPAVSSPLK